MQSPCLLYTSYLYADGIEQQSCVTVDQDRWDTGFTVGVLGEFRLNTHFQLRDVYKRQA